MAKRPSNKPPPPPPGMARKPSSKPKPPSGVGPRQVGGYASRPAERTKNPRRVRGGHKIASTERASESWAGQRWLRLIESGVEPAVQAEALEYATLGQTRTLGFEPGRIIASVQGRAPRAYTVEIAIEPFSPELWDRILATMADQAKYAAKLLAGELPANIEELFAPLGVTLYPAELSDLTPACVCDEAKEDPGSWCKHAACVGLLTADRLAENPWLIFTLRGLDKDDLLERLRHSRLLPAAPDGSAPVYAPHVGAVEALAKSPIDGSLEQFWDIRGTLEHLQLAPEKPQVSHPLLRRLGQSPFEGSSFPLVGLLATCYDVISDAALPSEAEVGFDAELDEIAGEQSPPADGPDQSGDVSGDASGDQG
ncbi:MAG: hypothetical protein AAFR96_00630 [Planctomycetota bacterium]